MYNKVVEKPVVLLEHDPDNPRIPSRLRSKAHDDKTIIDWMLKDANILELMGAIAQVGYFPGEPLLIVPKDVQNPEGHYYVVEGNRRLTSVKLLLNPNEAPIYKELIQEISNSMDPDLKEKLRELPVIIYKERDQILDYLGYRHVTGIKEWGAYEKAQYLEQLAKSSPYNEMPKVERFQALGRAIGSKADYVARLLTARELFTMAENKKLLDEEVLDGAQDSFTLLTTALYYKNIAEYINLDPKDTSLDGLDEDEYKQLLSWIYKKSVNNKTVIGESRNLKLLNEVVVSRDAVEYLKKSNDLPVAHQMASAKDPLDNFKNQLIRIENGLATTINLVKSLSGLSSYEHEAAVRIVDKAETLEAKVLKAIKS